MYTIYILDICGATRNHLFGISTCHVGHNFLCMVRNCTSTSSLLIRLGYVGSGRALFIAEPEVQFYTHPHGYKMFLRVNANGNGDGEG